MTDITAVGEILIDLTQSGTDGLGIPLFAANPGGAPANLAVAAARLGAKTAFIGKVGSDSFGDLLRSTLVKNGVDVSGLVTDPRNRTTLAVVALDETGERSFSFYREPSADVALRPGEISEAQLKHTKFLHFGSVSLTADPARTATLHAVRTAKAQGALISYDPNYRASLWHDEATAMEWMRKPLDMVDILKVSDEELPLLAGTADLDAGSLVLSDLGISLVLVTLGAEGAYYRFGAYTGHVPGVKVQVGDTNGAGDTFLGAVLAQLARLPGLSELSVPLLERIIANANRAAAITASRHGAIPAMPAYDEVFGE